MRSPFDLLFLNPRYKPRHIISLLHEMLINVHVFILALVSFIGAIVSRDLLRLRRLRLLAEEACLFS